MPGERDEVRKGAPSEGRKSGYASTFTDGEVATLVERIAPDVGRPLRLVRRFSSGDGPGAYELSESGGRRYVLKFLESGSDRFERAAYATSLLRSRGYPAPEFMALGSLKQVFYGVQTKCPGEPLSAVGVSPGHVSVLLGLNNIQADGIELEGPAWPTPVVDPVLHGGAGFCLIDTMMKHSPQTAALMRRLQDIVGSLAHMVPADRRDIVHFDFNGGNVLAEQSEITGVVDWEAVHTGDRAFDLVTFAWSSRNHRSHFITRAIELSGPEAVRVYAAHMIHRAVEWSIRFYPEQVEARMGEAERFLNELAPP